MGTWEAHTIQQLFISYQLSSSLLASATVELKMFACGGTLTDGTVTNTCLSYDLAQPCSNWTEGKVLEG